ncbi:MAG: histidine kinase [Kaistia sp. SCN 65-12]|mgnify:CR=1 FL=1|nr:MAG: histidine kinase [Kaistia sp. SCN 65-12]
MADTKHEDVNAPPPSAEQLRQAILQERLAEAAKQREHQTKQNEALTKFAESFLHDQISDEEVETVRRVALNAVRNGQYEAMVYSFPSSLCTDKGRAINSADPDWPETLQGKARQFYDRYVEYAKPQGFKLSAMIINFPEGFPGDVGFFISWKDDVK